MKRSTKRKLKKLVSDVLCGLILAGVIAFFIYAWLFGPYDYWAKEGSTMVKYHVDWQGNEEVIDSYELGYPYN